MTDDEYDNPIEELTDSDYRSATFGDDGVLRTTEEEHSRHDLRFEYHDDRHGNWTGMVVLGRPSSDAAFQRSNVTWRTITYYGR